MLCLSRFELYSRWVPPEIYALTAQISTNYRIIKLLGLIIDKDLSFEAHIDELCKNCQNELDF